MAPLDTVSPTLLLQQNDYLFPYQTVCCKVVSIKTALRTATEPCARLKHIARPHSSLLLSGSVKLVFEMCVDRSSVGCRFKEFIEIPTRYLMLFVLLT